MTNTKKTFAKHLLAGASVAALSVFMAQGAGATDRTTTATQNFTAINGVTGDAVIFDGVHVLTINDGVNLGNGTATAGASVVSGANGQGTLTFAGSSTVSHTVGVSAAADLLALNAGVTGSTVTLSGNAFVLTTTLTGSGTLALGGNLTGTTLAYGTADGVVTLASGKNITAAITATGGDATTGSGTLSLLGGDQTITGAVGVTGARLKAVNIATATGSTAAFTSDLYAVTTTLSSTGAVTVAGEMAGTTLAFTGDATLTIADDKDIVMTSITATGAGKTGAGTINLAGTTARLLSGDVGTSTDYLKKISFTGANATTTSGNLYVATIDFNDTASTLVIASGKNVTGSVIDSSGGKGTLTFSETTTADSTVEGNVGTSAGTGINILNHTAGADGSVLTLNGTANFITTTNIGAGQLQLNGNLTGNVVMATTAEETGALLVADGVTIVGNTTAADAGGEGTVSFAGDATVTGSLGAAGGNELHSVTIGAGAVTVSGDVAATTVNFAEDGSLTIASGATLEGAVTATTDGTGTLIFTGVNGGNITMTGDIGTTGDEGEALKLVTLGNGASGGTVAASGNIYAETINFATDTTLTVVGGKTLGADITTSGGTTGAGTITVSGDHADGAIEGNIGTATNYLKVLNHILGTDGDVLTLGTEDAFIDAYIATTNIGAGQIWLDGTLHGKLNFAEAAGATGALRLADGSDVTGNVTAAQDGEGTLEFNGSSTVTGTVGTTDIRLALLDFAPIGAADLKSKTITFTDNVFVDAIDTTDVVAGNKIVIAQGKTLTVTGDVDAGALTYVLGIKENGNADLVGKFASDGAMNLENAIIGVTIDSAGAAIETGNYYKVASGDTLTAPDNAVVEENSYLLKFTLATGDNIDSIEDGAAGDLYAVAQYDHSLASTAASGSNTALVGAAIQAVGNSGDANLDSTLRTLQTYTSDAQVAAALKTLAPDVSGATSAAAIQTGNLAISTVQNTVEARAGVTGSSVASGSAANKNGAWGQIFGQSQDQDTKNGVNGYQADVAGFALGADSAINDQLRAGIALAYGKTDANGAIASTDIDSYQGSVYGIYDMGKIYYEGVAAYTYNDYNTTRDLFNGSRASAGFSGNQYDVRGKVGYKLDAQGGVKITPFVGLDYTYLDNDGYTETGSTANLHVDNDSLSVFKSDLGARFDFPVASGGVTYNPHVSAAWDYDFVGDATKTTSNFTSASGVTFTSKGASVERNSYKLGAGLDVMTQDNLTVSLDYDYEGKSKFDSHAGSVKARFGF